jgi:hypothetical protein
MKKPFSGNQAMLKAQCGNRAGLLQAGPSEQQALPKINPAADANRLSMQRPALVLRFQGSCCRRNRRCK